MSGMPAEQQRADRQSAARREVSLCLTLCSQPNRVGSREAGHTDLGELPVRLSAPSVSRITPIHGRRCDVVEPARSRVRLRPLHVRLRWGILLSQHQRCCRFRLQPHPARGETVTGARLHKLIPESAGPRPGLGSLRVSLALGPPGQSSRSVCASALGDGGEAMGMVNRSAPLALAQCRAATAREIGRGVWATVLSALRAAERRPPDNQQTPARRNNGEGTTHSKRAADGARPASTGGRRFTGKLRKFRANFTRRPRGRRKRETGKENR